MIKRQKLSIFLDVKEDTRVQEVKRMVGGIVKRNFEEMKLIYKDNFLDDNKTVSECGITCQTTKAQSPALIGLVFKISGTCNPLSCQSFFQICMPKTCQKFSIFSNHEKGVTQRFKSVAY